jgi:hypothetical protein
VTSSDAPPPPGGPQREDAPEGGTHPDDDDVESLPSATDAGADVDSAPPVSHEASQSEESAGLQQENAETSLDQPSQ